MLTIQPFRALRFDTGRAGEIGALCCPPYDIISEEQRRAYLSANPHNIIRLELPRGDRPYQEAGETLRRWLREGTLRRDEKPGVYLYEEEFTAAGVRRRVSGFICLVKLEEFSKGVVLPHEETLSKAKADRFQLMEATGCNFSQIYSLYFDEDRRVAQVLEGLSAREPDQAFTDAEGVTHRLWCVYDREAAQALAQRMADKRVYIADGHHRYETALNFRNHLREQGLAGGEHPADYVMMMLVQMEHPGLVVFPTHRIVHGLPDFRLERVLEDCARYFAVEPGRGEPEAALAEAYAAGRKSFALYGGRGGWSLLTLRDGAVMRELLPEASDAYRGLDVSILHTLVLERIFGIDKENMARQQNLRYTRDAAEAVAAVDAGEADCAFLINPTRVEEIAAVAAAHEKMPQKSTYFYPKLITGMVMNQFLE